MAKILLLGPDRDRAGGLRSLLRQDSHAVHWCRDVERWPDAERDVLPELVVAAVRSTESVLRVRTSARRRFPAPLLFVQNESDLHRDLQIEDRLVDRLESPFMSEEFLARIDALVRVRRVILRESGGREATVEKDDEPEVERTWKGIASRFAAVLGARVPRFDKPVGPYLEVAARVAEWADARDGFDPGHAERVASFCGMMADGMRLPDSEASALIRAAMLHDIGKVALPVELLRREGPLDDDQMRLVRTHAERGANLLRALDTENDVAETILYHHERADGSGYHGKTLETTPAAARILAVAETYDAMTRSRVRSTVEPGEALRLLESEKGTKYDPACVDALSRALRPTRNCIPVSGPLGN